MSRLFQYETVASLPVVSRLADPHEEQPLGEGRPAWNNYRGKTPIGGQGPSDAEADEGTEGRPCPGIGMGV